ncbi:MAG: hypothetical protein ABIH37_04020 [archaeon]
MVFQALKRAFAIKPKSIDEFTEALTLHNAQAVTIEPQCVMWDWMNIRTSTVGYIGKHKYRGTFTSETEREWPIIFNEVYGERFGSERGVEDSYQRRLFLLKLIGATSYRAKQITKRLPEIAVKIKLPNSITQENYQTMLEEVERRGIKF